MPPIIQVDFPGAVWIGADPGNYEPYRNGLQPFAIVHHVMEGLLLGTDNYFHQHRPAAPSSSHFGIGRDTQGKWVVHQYVAVMDTAYGNGILIEPNIGAVPWLNDRSTYRGQNGLVDANYVSIVIENEGMHKWQDGQIVTYWEPTLEGFNLALALTSYLAGQYNIPINRAHICRHSDFNSSMGVGGKGWCPGKRWPHAYLLGELGDPYYRKYQNWRPGAPL